MQPASEGGNAEMRDAGNDSSATGSNGDGTDRHAGAGAPAGRAVEIVTPSRRRTANRRNALRSTGPRSVEGKRRSGWNALKHGILARATVLPEAEGGQGPREFRRLLQRLWDDLAPETVLEEMLVERIASCYWRLGRLLRAESAALQPDDDDDEGDDDDGIEQELQHRRREQELREDETLAPSERLRDLPGIESVLSAIETAGCEIQTKGFLEPEEAEAFQNVVGYVMNGMERPDTPRSRKAERDRKKEVLAALVQLREEMQSLQTRLASRANQQKDPTCQSVGVPSDPVASLLLRYETAIERQLYRGLRELERRQQARRGEPLPPRIQVDLVP